MDPNKLKVENNDELHIEQRQQGNDLLKDISATGEMGVLQRDESNSLLKDITRNQELQLQQGSEIKEVKLAKEDTPDDEMSAMQKMFWESMRGRKGEKGDSIKGDPGKDSNPLEVAIILKSDQDFLESVKGEDGYSPIKGRDYDDGEDGYTPIKGIDYDDGKPGEDAVIDYDLIISKIPKPKEVDKKEVEKLIKGLLKKENLDEKLKDKVSYSDLQNLQVGLNRAIASKTYSLTELDDVVISSPTNGQVLSYSETLKKWVNTTGGSGTSPLTTKGDIYTYSTTDARLPVGTNGQVLSADSGEVTGLKWVTPTTGSGTVNSGTQYRLAYYATTGTAVSEAGAITASRALVSDANGVPTHSTVTTTELGYVSGVTSSIQTQLNAKGAGTVTSVSSANGALTVATGTTTPLLTVNSAPILTTARTIGTITGDATSAGSSFDGSANNTNALTLATVNANVGSFGSATSAGTFTVNAKGLITAASSTTITPAVGSITGLGTGVATALAVNVGSAGAFVTFNGALGTPTSGTVTNLTGTASININGTVGATTPTTGVFTTLVAGSTTSLLLGTAGSAVGNIGFRNATSGTATVAPPTGALGTYTVTLPNAASTLPIFGQQITFTGPTAARTVTLPDASITVARTDAAQTFTGTQTFPQIITTPATITVTSNAGTVTRSNRINNFTNSSAATMTITMSTTSAADGDMVMVVILDASAAAQTITWVNTENSTATAPTTSNGSTTLPLTVGFKWNSATSKWRCIASA